MIKGESWRPQRDSKASDAIPHNLAKYRFVPENCEFRPCLRMLYPALSWPVSACRVAIRVAIFGSGHDFDAGFWLGAVAGGAVVALFWLFGA